MTFPITITYRHMDASPALDERIRELAERLSRASSHILRGHVVIEAPHQHSQQGRLFEVQLDLEVGGRQLAVHRTKSANHAHEDVYVALRDAFRAARRKLREHEQFLRRKVELRPAGEEEAV
jgi:ribosome-associated translation inhibitor RaiA